MSLLLRFAFNPTVVRLRLEGVKAQMKVWEAPFNPTVVRLRLIHELGTMCNDLSFNPTVVRLRLVGVSFCGGGQTTFNPTVVRLRPTHLLQMSALT